MESYITNDLKDRFRKKKAPLKAEEIIEAGYNYKEIVAMEKAGDIVRYKSGYYTCPEVDFDEEAMVVAMFPDGVFTLESALYFHGVLKERPFTWSVAVSKNISKSRFKADYPIIHPFYCEPKVLEGGVCEIVGSFGKVRVYTRDRLICEVLKYEDKMDRTAYKQAVMSYINFEGKDIKKFLKFAKERRVLSKARAVIGIWL